jgi:penicillin-binding protein 1A
MPRRRKNTKRKKRKSFLLIGISFLLLALLFGLMIGIQTVMAVMHDLPKLDEEDLLSLGQTTKIYAADGTLLAEVFGSENRTVVPLETIPVHLKQATISIEDERYYEHGGIDYEGLARAAFTNIASHSLAEGGSTITQQLVKTVYLTDERSFSRKLVEAVLATRLEQMISKDEILERYLNTIYYGEGAYGVEAASQTYFGKHVSELDLSEAATLAGLPNAPSAYSPMQNMQAAVDRRNTVLQKMADLGYITQNEADQAAAEPLNITDGETTDSEPYFVEYVKDKLKDMYGEGTLFEGGLQVYTTIDPGLQEAGTAAIKDTLNEEGDPAAALVSIEPRTGYIRAMVSSQDFSDYKFNLAAQGKRQPGSTFKPFVLAAAVEKGADPKKTYYMSKEIDIPLPGGGDTWHVATYDHRYYGVSSLEQAMLRSDNTVYAQLIMDVGADKVRNAAERMGIESYLAANPSIALGGLTEGVSPLEMSSAYGTLAAGGQHAEPIAITRIETADGKVDYQAEPKPVKALSDGVAYEVTRVLMADIQGGTSSKANIGRPAAGKTGSTENLQDAWFVGFTPDLSTAVWIGYPDEQIPMTDVHGGSVWGGGFPATIWKQFMMEATRDMPVSDFPQPKEKVVFKKLTGQYVMYSGGEPPKTTTNAAVSTVPSNEPNSQAANPSRGGSRSR